METLLNRYRNITVLLLVIFAQLILLAYQVKGNQDVRLIRVWAVTAVTPLARVIEGVRSGTMRTLQDYILFRDLKEENRQLKADYGKLKLENVDLRNQLETADRVKALASFQDKTPSKTIPARVIGTGTGANARMIFVDKGSAAGVMRGMAVITPDGIVGKVTASYPTASQVLLITDPGFAAGVISQKHRVHGTVRGLAQGGSCQVDYIQNEERVESGEMFFTSGDDRVFPKGLPVGVATAVRPGQSAKQIIVRPTAIIGGLEEVLIVTEGVHQSIPEYQAPATEVHLIPAPPPEESPRPDEKPSSVAATGTEADRLRDQYKKVGEAQNHVFGEGLPGSRPPDFTKLNEPAQAAAQPGSIQKPGSPAAAGAPKPNASAGGAAVPAGQAAQAVAPPGGTAVTGQPSGAPRTSVGQPASGTPVRPPTPAGAGTGQPAGASRTSVGQQATPAGQTSTPRTSTGAGSQTAPGGTRPPQVAKPDPAAERQVPHASRVERPQSASQGAQNGGRQNP